MPVSKRLRMVVAMAVVAAAAGFVAIQSADAAPGVIRLHLGSNGRYFQFGSTTQSLTTFSNNCKISSAEPVIHLSSTGGQSAPGLGADAIGVKGTPSSGNGIPCSQVDSAESLTMRPGSSADLAGKSFTGVRLDLEMTGNATVRLTLAGGSTSAEYLLQTGTAITSAQSSEPDYDVTVPYAVSSGPGDTTDACAAPNSSGPNSGRNDNCQWSVQPGFNFDTVTLTTVTGGSVALEGANDFGNDPNYDTLFYLSNSAPTPTNDSVTTDEDTEVSGNVLTNDSDPDGNPLTATKLTDPAHGSVTFAATGAFTYTPAENYHGSDSFTYAASDGSASTSATVSITVNAVNDPPIAGDDTGEVNQGGSSDIDVLGNDTDIDGDPLTPGNFASISPVGSTVDANPDDTVKFTPPSGYTGPASFTYKASDGALTSNTATVSLTVFPVICSNETVSDDDGDVIGTFTRLDDSFSCKRYSLDASAADGTVRFAPTGGTDVDYRGFLTFGPKPAPTPGAAAGTFSLLLEYDPTGGTTFRPVQWCIGPQFDGDGLVTGATIPPGETWCIASSDNRPDENGDVVTTWQVFGHDDPRYR